MAGDAGAALDGEAVRLVEDQELLVLVEDQALRARGSGRGRGHWRGSAGAGALGSGGTRTAWPARGGWRPRRACRRRGLAGAAEFLDGALGDGREMTPEPAVQADFSLVLGDRRAVRRSMLALPAQIGPMLEPAGELALEALVAWAVELGAVHAVGEVVLAGEAVLGVVIVVVAGAVAERPSSAGSGRSGCARAASGEPVCLARLAAAL